MIQQDVPDLSEDQIERDAVSLLAEFAQARHLTIEPPIPIDDIMVHLKLRLDFCKLARMPEIPRDPKGCADILGAIFFNEQHIFVDESLDSYYNPSKEVDESVDSYYNPSKEFEFRFILAHEVGHWRLHRARLAKEATHVLLLRRPTPASVGRTRHHWDGESPGLGYYWSSPAQEPIEWQADHFAWCLLMPRHLLSAAWLEWFGDSNPRIWRRRNLSFPAGVNENIFTAFDPYSDDESLNKFLWLFGKKFQVSMGGMLIRLEQIGLLRRSAPS
jgi:hypothetical protein